MDEDSPRMYCRHSKKEVLVEMSSDELEEESSESVFANEADNLEFGVENRSGKNLSKEMLDLKAHWDQMTKEEIEEELRINREAWERKRGRSEFPDQVLVPYMPRIPGRAVEKWEKEIQSEIEEVDYSSVEEEMDEEQPADLAIDMDDQADQIETRLCTGTDKSWTEQFKSYFSSSPFNKKNHQAIPTTDSGFSELDTSSQSSSSSNVACRQISEDGPTHWILSKSSIYGVIGLVVILGCLALFSGHPVDPGSSLRLSRASNATPLERRLHETTVLGRVIGAIDLQNSILFSNVTVPSLIEEATDVNDDILFHSGDPFKVVKDLSERSIQDFDYLLYFHKQEEIITEMLAWTPSNVPKDANWKTLLKLLRNSDIDLKDVKEWQRKFTELVNARNIGAPQYAGIFKTASTSLEDFNSRFNPWLEILCVKMDPIEGLDKLMGNYIEGIEAIGVLAGTFLKGNLDRYVPRLEKIFPIDKIRMSVNILNNLTASTPVRRRPPKALYAFPGGIEDLNKVSEDLKDPWLKKVLNEQQDLDKLEKSLKYILHFTGNLNYASELFKRFKAKNPPESLSPESSILRGIANLTLYYAKPNLTYTEVKKFIDVLENVVPKTQKTELEKLSISNGVTKYKDARQDICKLGSDLSDQAVNLREHIKESKYGDSVESNNIDPTSHNDILDQFASLAGNLASFISKIETKTTDLLTSISEITENAIRLEDKLNEYANWYRTEIKHYRYHLDDLMKIMYFLKNAINYRRPKREAGVYDDVRNSFKHLVDLEDSLQNITSKPLEYGFDELLYLNMSETAELSRELGYSRRFMETLLHLDSAISIIEQDGPSTGWINYQEAANALKKIKHKEDFGSIEESQNLTEHAKVYKVLDKIGATIPNMPLKNWTKEAESALKPNPKLTEALYQLDGLDYAKMRKEKNMDKLLVNVEEFFAGFFGRPVPEKTEETFLDLSAPLLFMAILTLLHILPATHFYRHELYLKAYRANLSGPGYEPPKPPAPVRKPHVPCPLPIRQVNKKGVVRALAKGDPVEPEPEKKEETKATEKEQMIWYTPPTDEPNEDDENMKPEEESNLLWVPFGYQKTEMDPISYGSDDLRSIRTRTLSTQSDRSDMMDVTRSDYTIPVGSDSENEDILDRREYAEFPQEAEVKLEEIWEKYKYPWALKNRLTLQGYRNMTQMHVKEVKAFGLMDAIQNEEDKAKENRAKENDVQARIQWDQMLEKDMDEVLRRRVNQEEVCRIQMKKQNLEQRLVDLEKASRDPLRNAEKYIQESYIPEPDEEISITRIAFESVNKIDNFIQSTYQDRYDHIYRCRSDMYTHDWARVKMSKDEPEDCDFYDACYVFPWPEVFEKVASEYHNKLIAVSSPMFSQTVGTLWHWLFEHDVQYMVMVNQFIEKYIQTSEVWFPERKGDVMRVRRSRVREYLIECTDAKMKFDKCGVQRTFDVTLVMHGRRFATKRLKLLHMIDWDQDGLPKEWQHYVRICERINRESMKRPVAVMSKHGNGRAMTIIISLMAAILARLDDDVSIHSMVQGARASKRHAITCCNQVYFWRMVHYELLFRWFKPLRNQRVHMDERFRAYQDIALAHKYEYLSIECRMWWYRFECELARYKRMEYMVDYLRKIYEGLQYEWREERRGPTLYDAMDKSREDLLRPSYMSLKPIRRKPLREGDKPPIKKYRLPVIDRDDLTEQEQVYAEFEIDPMVVGRKLDGCYDWVKPSEENDKFVKGVSVPENWKHWYTKEEQTGVVVPNPFF